MRVLFDFFINIARWAWHERGVFCSLKESVASNKGNSLSRTDLLLRAGTSDFIRNLHKVFSLKDLNFHSEFAFASIHLSNFIVKSYQRQLSLILGRLFRDVLAPLLLTILNKHSAGQLQSCYSCAFEFHNSIIR